MTMQGVYASSAEIIRRLKLEMPISVVYEDPFPPHGPMSMHRENVLALLVVDTHNLVIDGQACAALYAEMGRFARAAQLAADKAETRYRKWKAQMRHECAAKAAPKKTAGGKLAAKQGPTGDEVETYYRTHKDYEALANEPRTLAAQAGLFEDLRWAFKLKAETHNDHAKLLGGHERTMRMDDANERLTELESLQREANEIIAASGSAEAAAAIAASVSGTEVRAPIDAAQEEEE